MAELIQVELLTMLNFIYSLKNMSGTSTPANATLSSVTKKKKGFITLTLEMPNLPEKLLHETVSHHALTEPPGVKFLKHFSFVKDISNGTTHFKNCL